MKVLHGGCSRLISTSSPAPPPNTNGSQAPSKKQAPGTPAKCNFLGLQGQRWRKASGDSETSWWGGRQVPLTEPRLWAGPRTHVRLSPRPPPALPQPPRTSNVMHTNTTRGSPCTACWSFPPPGMRRSEAAGEAVLPLFTLPPFCRNSTV